MFKIFLDKADQRKIELFRYLENRPGLVESKEKIIEDLYTSDFLLNKIIEELNSDFEEYKLAEEFQLILSGATVTLIESGLATSNQFEILFIKNSLMFSILSELFFEKFTSVSEYADRNFISHPPIYKKLRKLKNYFEPFQFTINKKFVIEGNEKNIRSFFSFLFPKLFYQKLDIYPLEIRKQVRSFIKMLEKNLTKPISEYAKLKLAHFLAISFYRMSQGKFIEPAPLIVNETFLKSSSEYQWIAKWLKAKGTKETAAYMDYEIDQLLAFLVSEEIVYPPEYIENVERKFFRKLSKEFILSVEEHFPTAHKYIRKKRKQIDLLHFQIIYFKLEYIEATKEIDISYFVENYAEYVSFCREYLNRHKSKKTLWDMKEYLFFHYLVILEDSIPLQTILEPIYMYIDFSFGRTYNSMIQRNIEKITSLNIVYQSYIDEQTDLILSDIHFEEREALATITWLAPPRAVDWANLTNQLMLCREEKYNRNQE